jgi:hypothetical protein
MAVNPDFRELFSEFNAADVRYLVVGRYAVTFHARPRFTKDLDIWIDSHGDNARKVWEALAKFGAPLDDVTPSDLATPGMILQIGVAPNRIDILTSLEGVDFEEAWPRRDITEYGDCEIGILSKPDLIENKRRVARPQDLIDVEALSEDSES